MLDAYVLSQFEQQNRRRERSFVLHLGDRGFYAEVTTVHRAMAYALANGIELLIDSSEFAYAFEHGWSDYFLPICREYEPDLEPLGLPERYAAVHARRGDKVGTEDHFYPTEPYLGRVPDLERSEALFVMSDDYAFVEEVEASLRRRGLPARVHTLCSAESRGFDIWKVRRGERYFDGGSEGAPLDRRYVFEETARLLAETVIAARAESFVSTHGSNVGTVIRWLHPDPTRCPQLDRADLSGPRVAQP